MTLLNPLGDARRLLGRVRLARHWRRILSQIEQQSLPFVTATDPELRRASLSLRYRAYSGEPLRQMLSEAFALVREAAWRAVGMRHYDVQLLGGAVLFDHSVAEMQTGEGKTLTATLPLYLAALSGKGAHLATANDYLASRDAEIVRPVFAMLGMQVGVVQSSSSRPERRDAYQCDVTYGAAREFGFDFLRDRLGANRSGSQHQDLLGRMLGSPDANALDELLQRGLHFMLVDEADSILIDEARTPLVVSSLPGESQEDSAAVYRWSAKSLGSFEEQQDYIRDDQRRAIRLTAEGRRKLRELRRPSNISSIAAFDLYEHIELALRVRRHYSRDQHYVLRDGEVVIVDENTGRLAEGRKWRDGIHQAVEAREGVPVSVDSGEAARVTVQHFFLLYQQLAGMTGTAMSSSRELSRIYGLKTRSVPTHCPVQRLRLPDRICGTSDARWAAVAAEAQEVHQTGRPVLIGTRSIEKSERLSKRLTATGIPHEVLNARRHSEEAAIVARAGESGRVTVATNMAGRGTDIQLEPSVAELGGLHVICTEYHDSQRIDRQLSGRSGRQGDPGTYRQYGALEDDILVAAFASHVAERLRRIGATSSRDLSSYAKLLRRAQARVSARQFRQRKMLLFHEQQRRQSQQEMGQDPYLDAAM